MDAQEYRAGTLGARARKRAGSVGGLRRPDAAARTRRSRPRAGRGGADRGRVLDFLKELEREDNRGKYRPVPEPDAAQRPVAVPGNESWAGEERTHAPGRSQLTVGRGDQSRYLTKLAHMPSSRSDCVPNWIDVAWGDMDSYAHVNNVVYFRYFENARIAYLDRIGWRSPQARSRSGADPAQHLAPGSASRSRIRIICSSVLAAPTSRPTGLGLNIASSARS